VQTLAASVGAGLFRILLMPVDACKTILQVRRASAAGGTGQRAASKGVAVQERAGRSGAAAFTRVSAPRAPLPQVEGKNGFAALMNKVKVGGPTVLYHGALAASVATFVGHYPCEWWRGAGLVAGAGRRCGSSLADRPACARPSA
jgi:hypothetical protein